MAAALALIDEEGGHALSMRSLAKRLDLQVSSLYNHVASRRDLIETLRARIVDEIDTSTFSVAAWDAALEGWARSYLAAFASHPNIIQLLATTPIRDESTLEMYDRVVRALGEAGWPLHETVAVMRATEALVLGSALDIVAPIDLLTRDSVPIERRALRSALDPSRPDAFGARQAFEIGLTALIAGLRERFAASARSSQITPQGETVDTRE